MYVLSSCHWLPGRRDWTLLATCFFPGVVESNEISLETPLLQAAALQPLIIGLVLLTLYEFHYPSLDTLQDPNVIPELNVPEVDTALKLWPHQFWAQAKNHFLNPTGYTTADPSQDAIDSPGHSWLIFNQLVTSTPRSLPIRQLSNHSSSSLQFCRGFYCSQSVGPSTWSKGVLISGRLVSVSCSLNVKNTNSGHMKTFHCSTKFLIMFHDASRYRRTIKN